MDATSRCSFGRPPGGGASLARPRGEQRGCEQQRMYATHQSSSGRSPGSGASLTRPWRQQGGSD
eukprot:5058789-Alexandrium_andersonii.AAC.1